MGTAPRAQRAPDTRGPVRKLLTSFGFQIIAALVLGIAAGLIGRQLGATAENPTALSATLDTIGSSYVTLLRAGRPAAFAWKTEGLHPSGALGDARRGTAEAGEAALDHGARAFVRLLEEVDRFSL